MTRPAGRAAVNAAAYPCNLLAIDPEGIKPFGVLCAMHVHFGR